MSDSHFTSRAAGIAVLAALAVAAVGLVVFSWSKPSSATRHEDDPSRERLSAGERRDRVRRQSAGLLGTMCGRALLADTQQPYRGTLRVSNIRDGSAEAEQRSVATDQIGRFTSGLPTGRLTGVFLETGSHCSFVAIDIDVKPDSTIDLGDVQLAAPTTLRVSVVDATGKVVPDASVRAELVALPQSTTSLEGATWLGRVRDETATSDGAASFSGMIPGLWRLAAQADGAWAGHDRISIMPGVPVVNSTIVLTRVIIVRGTVLTEEGTPIGGACVRAAPCPVGQAKIGSRTSSTTDAGAFTLKDVVWPRIDVVVDLPGRQQYTYRNITPVEGRPIELRIPSRSGLGTLVIDDETDRPIADARVQITADARGDEPRFSACGVTDLDGAFRATTCPPMSDVRVLVEAAGYVSWPEDGAGRVHLGAAPSEASITARMRRAPAVTGSVRSERGAPIAGAEVRLVVTTPRSGYLASEPVRTDTSGSFRVLARASGPNIILVAASGYVQPELPPNPVALLESGSAASRWIVHLPLKGEVQKNVQLVIGRTVGGRVETTNALPVPDALIEASPTGRGVVSSARTDQFGHFAIAGLVPDTEVTLRAVTATGQSGRVTVRVPAASEATSEVTIRVEEGGELDGKIIVQPAGKSDLLAEMGVSLVARDTGLVTPVRVDSVGAFSSSSLAAGEYGLTIRGPGIATSSRGPFVVRAGSCAHAGEIVVGSEAECSGLVLTEAGEPLDGVDVEARLGGTKPAGEVLSTAVTDSNGMFCLRALGAGQKWVVLRRKGYQVCHRLISIPETGIRVTMLKSLSLSGTVIDASGAGIANVRVVAVAEQGAAMANPLGWTPDAVWTAPDGTFSVTGLDEGRYCIAVGSQDGDGNSGFAGARVGPFVAGSGVITVALNRGMRIEGCITDAEASNGGALWLLRAIRTGTVAKGETQFSRVAYSRPDGTFSFGDLRDGTYDIVGTVTVGPANSDLRVGLNGVEAGSTGVELVASRSVRLKGRVTMPGGEPLNCGVTIRVQESGGWGLPRVLRTDTKGTFETPALEGDLWYDVLVVDAPAGTLPVSTKVSRQAASLVLELRRSGAISGMVVDDDGEAVEAGVAVIAMRADGGSTEAGSTAATVTGGAGEFHIDGLGDFEFVIVAGGTNSRFQPSAYRSRCRVGDEDLRIVARRGLAVSGQLRARSESAAVRGRVTCVVSGITVETRVAAGGAFNLRGLPEGTVELTFIPDSGEKVELGRFVSGVDAGVVVLQ